MAASTLTSKGQITLPKDVREKLNLKPGDRVDFVITEGGDEARLRPLRGDLRTLQGFLKRPGRKPVSLEEMELAIRNRASDK